MFAACNPMVWSELQVYMNICAKSCFRLIPLISPRNENQFSIFSSYLLSLSLSASSHKIFHTKSNNVRVRFPLLCHLMCVSRVSRECTALPGWTGSGFLAIYNVNRQPSIGASPRSRGERRESCLNATQVSATHSGLFLRVFLARSRVSPPFVGITPLSLSQLSADFPLLELK